MSRRKEAWRSDVNQGVSGDDSRSVTRGSSNNKPGERSIYYPKQCL